MMISSKFKVILWSILLPMMLSSCGGSKVGQESTEEVLAPDAVELNAAQYRTAGIQLGRAETRDIRSMVQVNGTVNVPPQNIATVSVPLGGFVKNTGCMQGSQVRRGEVLALVENMEFIQLQQAYLETKARFHYAEVEYKRHRELYEEKVYSEKNVQQTETEYLTLKSQMKGLEQKLLIAGADPAGLTEDNITGILAVKAPISGYIRTVNVNIGKYVSPTDVLFEIVDPGNIILELTLFEKDVPLVSSGQKVRFTTPDSPERVYSGTIYQAGKALDKDKTARAYAHIENSGGRLLSGMYVNADIEILSRRSLSLPDEAVVQFDSSYYIFLHKGTRTENGKEIHDFQAIRIHKGTTDNGFTEITLPAGIDPGSVEIVVKGAYSVLSAWKNSGEMAC